MFVALLGAREECSDQIYRHLAPLEPELRQTFAFAQEPLGAE